MIKQLTLRVQFPGHLVAIPAGDFVEVDIRDVRIGVRQ
jgi:hypothetical protein